jgi:hypothetical protein
MCLHCRISVFLLILSDAGTGGPGGPPPNILRITQPYSNREEQIIPTYYYWHPQCFSPSGITDTTKPKPYCKYFLYSLYDRLH